MKHFTDVWEYTVCETAHGTILGSITLIVNKKINRHPMFVEFT